MPQVDLTRIGSNIGAMYALQSLMEINNKLAATQTRLATGRRINSAADDPAGLTIATKMQARADGLRVTMDNISDAQNMLSVAEAGLSKLNEILVKMRSKANQSASDTLGSTERQTIQSQLQAFAEQIDDIIYETKWNGVQLLDGTVEKTFQTGVDPGETTTWKLSQKHDAITLKVAHRNETPIFNAVGFVPESFTSGSLAVSSPTNGMLAVKTGTYSIEILGKGYGGQGMFTKISDQYISGVTGASAVPVNTASAATELASGRYMLEVTGSSQTGISSTSSVYLYRITNADTGSVVANVTNYVDLSAATGTSGVLLNAAGGSSLGVKLDVTGTMTVGEKFNFEYIKSSDAKYALKDSSNIPLTIDMDGQGAGSAVNTFAYFNSSCGLGASDGAITVDTGRGIQFASGASSLYNDHITIGQKYNFDFEEAGNYIVNVSTTAHSADYMRRVMEAMDIVNQSMADLGSLMARMSIKQDAASLAQINVTAAYSRIMNANMAEEQVNASKFQVLQQTSVAMLAQANQAPQFLLQLFQ